jgi:hypothetical protein
MGSASIRFARCVAAGDGRRPICADPDRRRTRRRDGRPCRRRRLRRVEATAAGDSSAGRLQAGRPQTATTPCRSGSGAFEVGSDATRDVLHQGPAPVDSTRLAPLTSTGVLQEQRRADPIGPGRKSTRRRCASRAFDGFGLVQPGVAVADHALVIRVDPQRCQLDGKGRCSWRAPALGFRERTRVRSGERRGLWVSEKRSER